MCSGNAPKPSLLSQNHGGSRLEETKRIIKNNSWTCTWICLSSFGKSKVTSPQGFQNQRTRSRWAGWNLSHIPRSFPGASQQLLPAQDSLAINATLTSTHLSSQIGAIRFSSRTIIFISTRHHDKNNPQLWRSLSGENTSTLKHDRSSLTQTAAEPAKTRMQIIKHPQAGCLLPESHSSKEQHSAARAWGNGTKWENQNRI